MYSRQAALALHEVCLVQHKVCLHIDEADLRWPQPIPVLESDAFELDVADGSIERAAQLYESLERRGNHWNFGHVFTQGQRALWVK
jgi:hypothetical protein